MVRQLDLHLVSNLRSDAALYAEPTALQRQADPRRKDHLPRIVCAGNLERRSAIAFARFKQQRLFADGFEETRTKSGMRFYAGTDNCFC